MPAPDPRLLLHGRCTPSDILSPYARPKRVVADTADRHAPLHHDDHEDHVWRIEHGAEANRQAAEARGCNGLRSLLQLADDDSTSTLSLEKKRKEAKNSFSSVTISES
jgi:hypothetical protein